MDTIGFNNNVQLQRGAFRADNQEQEAISVVASATTFEVGERLSHVLHSNNRGVDHEFIFPTLRLSKENTYQNTERVNDQIKGLEKLIDDLQNHVYNFESMHAENPSEADLVANYEKYVTEISRSLAENKINPSTTKSRFIRANQEERLIALRVAIQNLDKLKVRLHNSESDLLFQCFGNRRPVVATPAEDISDAIATAPIDSRNNIRGGSCCIVS